jgi:hypothetical protein
MFIQTSRTRSADVSKPQPLKPRTLLATVIVSLALSTMLAFSRPATIEIDGQSVHSDIPPVTTGRQAYLPLRAVTAWLGARVSYNKSTRSILVVRGSDRLKLRVGVRSAILNGRRIELSHAPFTVRGRTMVAAHTVERALGPRVRYNPGKSRIDVLTTASTGQGPASSETDAF